MLDGVKIEDLNTEYKNAATKGTLQLCPNDAPYYSISGNCVSCN